MLQIDKENDTIFYKYDNQGNTLEQTSSKGTTTYQYDIYNRTRQVTTKNGDTIKNKYDPLGFRYKKEVNGEAHHYIFDGWSITAETNKDDELKSREVRGYGLVKKEIGNNQYYYHQNEHGDITHLTNIDEEIENSYQYDVFGNIREQQENVENVFKYAGEQLDNETQQYYLRARFYNPVIARFTQEDVYRGDGLNLYVYVVNNPLLWFDPSGYAKKCKANNDTNIQTETNIISPSPEQLLGIKHANMQNPRAALEKTIMPVQGAKSKQRLLTSNERKMANEILDDISSYYFLNDQGAYNRLKKNGLHTLTRDYAGWESVYIDVSGTRGVDNTARVIFRQTNNGTIEWQVKLFH